MVWNGRLRGAKCIGMAGIEGEQAATVLKDKSPALDRDAGTEGGVVALYEGNDIAIVVHGRKVSGIAGGRSPLASVQLALAGSMSLARCLA